MSTEGPTTQSGVEPRDAQAEGEPSVLGAAAPVPVARGKQGQGTTSAGVDARRRGAFGLTRYQLVLIILLVVYLIAISPLPIFGGRGLSAGFAKTPKNKIGLSYGGGPFEAAHFQRVVQPGSSLFFNGLFDQLYLYPADQQNYIISLSPRVGAVRGKDSIIAPTSDRVQLTVQAAVYFKLNTDLVRQFHEQIGLQYAAYTSGGWSNLLQDAFRQNIENAVQTETRKYPVAALYGNAQSLSALQDAVQTSLNQRLVAALGAQYFCSPSFRPGGPCDPPTFIVKQIDIPSTVSQAYVNQRAAEIQVAQRQAEAQGIAALAKQLEAVGQNYVLLKAIESGSIKFWVIPSNSGVSLTTPGAGGSSAAPTATPSSGG